MDTAPRASGTSRRRASFVAIVGLAVGLSVLALPTFAADPSVPPEGGSVPAGPPKGVPPAHAGKATTPITVSGTVSSAQDADGVVEYRLSAEGKTWRLDAGPPWFHGDDHPLRPFVGKAVEVTGSVADGSDEIDVETVDGKRLRGEGPPPWAGGWFRVGEGHPGWSQEKADRFKARFGDCFPPGHCRQGTPSDD
jgi:hypothetical protein